MTNKENIKYIKRCFTLAKKGQGSVSPNPMVGVVIVKNGKVIGEGWHKKYGYDHAEVMAFNNAKEDVSGATLYVNLEPCCHTNKNTPPCVPLIISKKIKRVVLSNEDPNPEVSGKGIAKLRATGIEVMAGVCSDEGNEVNRFFFNYMKTGLPYVVLKIAQSMDGKIGFTNKEQKWLTGEESKIYVHQMRAQLDAVLIGANTLRVDNPKLTVRKTKGRNPIRIIIDGKLSTLLSSAIVQSDDFNHTIVFTCKGNNSNKISLLESRGIEVIQLASKQSGLLDLRNVLTILGERKIISLFVEGGQSIFSQFLEKKLFDEIILLQSPKILGTGLSPFRNEYRKDLFINTISTLGNDIKIVLRKL